MFAQCVGCTPVDYINTYRLGKAHFMLGSEPEMKIKEVASACGFDDQLYFSKLYSKTYGCSPRAYRQKLTGCASGEKLDDISDLEDEEEI